MEDITLADWWEITKAAYSVTVFGSQTAAVSSATGDYWIVLTDPDQVSNWIEEMEYRHGGESELFN